MTVSGKGAGDRSSPEGQTRMRDRAGVEHAESTAGRVRGPAGARAGGRGRRYGGPFVSAPGLEASGAACSELASEPRPWPEPLT